MTRSRAMGALLVLAAIDQAGRGLADSRAASFSPTVTALQALSLAAALILVAALSSRQARIRWWQVLVSAGCLSGLIERVFFGQVSLPLAFGASGKWDWTAFAFADMYIVAGAIAAYWKHELENKRPTSQEQGHQEQSDGA